MINLRSQLSSELWQRYMSNRAALVGLLLFVSFVIIALAAPFLAPYTPWKSGETPPLHPPSAQYPMGTDNLGRDMLSSTMFGARISLSVGMSAALLSTVLGIVVGAFSGYSGGKIDLVLMRATEVLQVVPPFFLAIVIVSLLKPTIWNVVFVIGALGWPTTARLVRAQFLSLRDREFVEAARIIGVRRLTLIFDEILPNALSSAIVNGSLDVGRAILVEAGLSFLGLGDINSPSWGLMLNNAQHFLTLAWWIAAFPGLCISLLVLSVNLMGDGLESALSPKQRQIR